MPKNSEVEIKFRVTDVRRLEQSLTDSGFQLKTPPTHEVNSLYDRPGNPLRRQGVILRLRKYGERLAAYPQGKGHAWKIQNSRGARDRSRKRSRTRRHSARAGLCTELCLREIPLRVERRQRRSCGGPHADRGCRRNRGSRRAGSTAPLARSVSSLATTSPSRTANFFWSGRKQLEARRKT